MLQYKLEKLTGNGTYEIKIKGATRSVKNSNVFINGKDSELKKVLMGDCPVPTIAEENNNSSNNNTTVILGIVSGALVLLLIFVGLVVCRYVVHVITKWSCLTIE